MSRSYKKHPVFKMTIWGKDGKKCANRKVRRTLKNLEVGCPKGNYYKSFGLDTYDIVEYRSYQTKEDARKEWNESKTLYLNGTTTWKSEFYGAFTEEEALNLWKQSYKCK